MLAVHSILLYCLTPLSQEEIRKIRLRLSCLNILQALRKIKVQILVPIIWLKVHREGRVQMKLELILIVLLSRKTCLKVSLIKFTLIYRVWNGSHQSWYSKLLELESHNANLQLSIRIKGEKQVTLCPFTVALQVSKLVLSQTITCPPDIGLK